MLPREEIRNLRSSNCWKCIESVNPTITTLFLYIILIILRSHQAERFGSWGVGGGGGACAPRAPPCLWTCLSIVNLKMTLFKKHKLKKQVQVGMQQIFEGSFSRKAKLFRNRDLGERRYGILMWLLRIYVFRFICSLFSLLHATFECFRGGKCSHAQFLFARMFAHQF